ncbi:MAG: hypothetical protein HN742_09540 [Lentisphaerae bacterium]|jgi:neutral ceramidase|nr:hypothetical protein [Lentisphaerota bacterium]MBT5606733.1 hypothetical protein [Lentisphaerota bacterium]MBT7056964.1 hypothetical protein [Lentisphaerota bacterium]MBT7842105.1 hypothetical protein [Lentisphaerota bacterium]
MSTELTAGVAKAVITPPVGVDLGGYGGRAGPVTGVHDELEAGALCLCADAPLLLMTADLVGLDTATADAIRGRLAERTGIPAENVFITCTHTHSGPAMPCLPTLGKPDPAYLKRLKKALVELGVHAWQRRKPAAWGVARERVTIGVNRREVTRRPGFLEEEGRGTIVDYVDVLRVDDSASGTPMAVWMCHPAHPVALRHTNTLVSADWVGYARREVERTCLGAVALFAQGCCGNITCWPQGTFELAEEHGRTLGSAVAKAVAAIIPSTTAEIVCAGIELGLPLFDPPAVGDAEAELEKCVEARDANGRSGNRGTQLMLDGNVQWAAEVVRLAAAGVRDQVLSCPLSIARIGDFGIVALAGEPFVEYALAIDAGSPFNRTAVLGYTNGNVGYIPTAAACCEGGYEAEKSVRYYGTTRMRPEAEQVVLDAVHQLVEQIV